MVRFKELLIRVFWLCLDPLLLSLITLKDDGVLSILLHQTGGDHLVDDASSLLALLGT